MEADLRATADFVYPLLAHQRTQRVPATATWLGECVWMGAVSSTCADRNFLRAHVSLDEFATPVVAYRLVPFRLAAQRTLVGHAMEKARSVWEGLALSLHAAHRPSTEAAHQISAAVTLPWRRQRTVCLGAA